METYNEILERMKENFLELSGFLPDDASDLGIRLRVLAGEIFSLNNNVQWLKNQMFANNFGYDFHMKKDFSNILNNTLSYGLN